MRFISIVTDLIVIGFLPLSVAAAVAGTRGCIWSEMWPKGCDRARSSEASSTIGERCRIGGEFLENHYQHVPLVRDEKKNRMPSSR